MAASQRARLLDDFVARIRDSAWAERLALKGGLLLPAHGVRRPTHDVDLHLDGAESELGVMSLVAEIAESSSVDGIQFEVSGAEIRRVRDHPAHNGASLVITGVIDRHRLPIEIDLSMGDPTWPPVREVSFTGLSGRQLRIRSFPLTMVLAEKLLAVQQFGTHKRRQDLCDIRALVERNNVDGAEIARSLTTVARHRGIAPAPLDAGAMADPAWMAYARFAAPLLLGDARGCIWDSRRLAWDDVKRSTPEVDTGRGIR